MAEEPKKAAADTPAAEFVDEARASIDGTRKAAQWIASALGAIPSLAILAALVRAPGEAGFNGYLLVPGIFLAAAGALVGILAFADVLTPVPLTDEDLVDFDMHRVPGHPFDSFDELRDSIDALRRAVQADGARVAAAEANAKQAEAESARAEAELKKAEAALAKNSKDPQLKQVVKTARDASDQKALEAREKAGLAAREARGLPVWSEELKARERLRAEAFRLKAADEVRRRFTVFLVALGIALLALAPNTVDDGEAPTLVSLKLSKAGQTALDCPTSSLQGLRVGGEDEAPLIVTFPTEDCASKLVAFKVTEPEGFGSVEEVEAITAE
jgi:hypothetical protein